jgi:hypothetical protein
VEADFLCDTLDWLLEESNDDIWPKGAPAPQLMIQELKETTDT